MSIVLPPFLKPGDTVGITCPSGYVSQERIAYAAQVLRRWGYHVRIGRTVGTGKNYMAGTDEERRTDLQAMLDDPNINAILFGRGGYGTSRIIDDLDFSTFREKPKWLCGFSDITVLSSHINQLYDIATLHSPMCGAFTPDSEGSYYIESLRRALGGQSLRYEMAPSSYNRTGSAEGIMIGGNLALLAHLTGSLSQWNTEGKILFIEDIGEHYYNVDRMLLNLKRSGQLRGLKGLLVGTFNQMEDTDRPFGQTVEEIIRDKVEEYDYPLAFNFPCGHDTENVTLPLGVTQRLEVSAQGSVLNIAWV